MQRIFKNAHPMLLLPELNNCKKEIYKKVKGGNKIKAGKKSKKFLTVVSLRKFSIKAFGTFYPSV